MKSLNISLAHSLDKCCEWMWSLDAKQNVARNTKGHVQQEATNAMLGHAGGDTGYGKPHRPG